MINFKTKIMGCDIHLHSEVKINNNWYHYKVIDIDRNYSLFAKMANVRNSYGIVPISEPKSIPSDISVVTKIELNSWGEDAHSSSYLTLKEIKILFEWSRGRLDLSCFGWFFGDFYDCFNNNDGYTPKEIQDVRFVFWFDN